MLVFLILLGIPSDKRAHVCVCVHYLVWCCTQTRPGLGDLMEGWVVICPDLTVYVLAMLQVVEPDHMLLALNFVRQVNNPYFRAGFNSLGAYGTINHLHFQVIACHMVHTVPSAANAIMPLR
jgi:hypothetical protein